MVYVRCGCLGFMLTRLIGRFAAVDSASNELIAHLMRLAVARVVEALPNHKTTLLRRNR
jgi:hypothetical protein